MKCEKLISKLHQWWGRKQTSSRGDTLVEVSIAIAVMGVIITGTTAIINRSILSVQNSIESIAMKNEVNGQSEMLHYIFDTIDGKNEKVGTEIVRIARSTSDISNYNLCTNNPGVDYKVFHLYSTGNSNNPVGLSKLAEYDARKVISSKVWVTAKYYESKKNSMDYIDFYVQSCWTPHGASTANGSNKAVARIAVNPDLTNVNKQNNYYNYDNQNKFVITGISPKQYQLYSGTSSQVTITGEGFTSNTKVWVDLDHDSVMDSNEECTGRWLHNGAITCNMPTDRTTAIAGGKYTVFASNGNKTSWLAKSYEYKGSVCENANSESECQVDIDSNMIPIKYTGSTSSPRWAKANINSRGDWYSYGDKKWANAVTVKRDKLNYYKNASANTMIKDEDVLGYWVYIPRYAYVVMRYKVSDPVAQAQNFNIRFQTQNDSKNIPYATGDWATHPAFSWGGTELNGIWVAKFETTGNLAHPTVKPNSRPIQHTKIGDQYDAAIRMGVTDSVGNRYGNRHTSTAQNYQNLAATKSHMMKNSEWGAAAYLSASIYGYGVNKVRPNTYSGFRTGCGPQSSGSDELGSSCHQYYTSLGRSSSTTGDTYGIYDMASGYEFVMASYSTDRNTSSNMNFSSPARSPYVDIYPSSIFSGGMLDNNDRCSWEYCGGQAMYETKIAQSISDYHQSWGDDQSFFVYSGEPWFERGGFYDWGMDTGIFATSNDEGDGTSDGYSDSFRVVLSQH